jgi:SAM-dependent methyltransferase
MTKLLWSAYARFYDRIAGLSPYREMLGEVMAAIDPKPGMRVLDAGCGTGELAERLAAACPEVKYLGVDLSAPMLARARSRRTWPGSFRFVEGDLNDLLAESTGIFDCVASVNVLWTLPDPAKTLSRMTAALQPGGRMVHTTPRFAFRAHAIVWRHLRSLGGWRLVRALLGLPILLVAGGLNLLLVLVTAARARGPKADRRWHADGLVALLRAAGVETRQARSCYAGQGHLVVAELPQAPHAPGNPLPGPGGRL